MERLRAKWPHTLVLDFAPEGGLSSATADLGRLTRTADPIEICRHFVEFTSGGTASYDQRAVLRDVVEAVLASERADDELAVAIGTGTASRGSVDLDMAGSIDQWLARAGSEDDWLAEAVREAKEPREADGNNAAA